MNQNIPPPPPGFTMIDPPDLSGGVPPPPPGFQVIGAQPPAVEWSDDWDVAKTAIEAMPEDKREAARKEWARAVVKRERAKGGIGQTVDDTVRRLARGVPVLGGLADEGNAMIASGLGYDYDMQLAYERAKDAEGDEEAPMTSAVTQIAGGLATAPIAPFARGATALRDIGLGAAQGGAYAAAHGFTTGEDGFANRLENAAVSVPAGVVLGGAIPVVTNSAQAIRRGVANQGRAGAYGSVSDDLQGGVDEFADQVSAGASRNNVATNRRTLDILGEEMERAGGNVPQAQQAAIARIAQETGVTPQTAAQQIRRLTQVHEGSDLLLAEYPSVAASDAAQRLRPAGNVDLDELGRFESTGLQGKLDYLANNGNAQSAHDVRNALALRQETLAPSMRETLGDMAPRVATGARGTRPATIEDTADLVETARRLAAQEYDAAYNTPVATPQRYQQIPRFFEYLANRAATSAPEVAATIRNAVNQVAVRRPDGSIGVQGLRQMQQGRTTIRGQIEALTRNGRADLANEIRPLYRLLTRTMEEMSPDWAVANRRWADMNLSQVAQDLGDAFATKAGPRFREQLAEFQNLAPEAQDIVRVHVLQKLSDKLDNLGDAHAVSKLFSNDASRNLIRQLFGNEAAVQFTRAVRNQKVAEVSQNMTRNSATHRRGVAQKQADAETGLVAAVENANVRGVRNWLLERMTQILTERKNRPMADILSTPMNDTANVARHIHNMRRQQDRLRTLEQPTNTSRNAIVSTTSQTGSAPGYADGGAVLPRISKDPYDDIPITTNGTPEQEVLAKAAQAKMYADNMQGVKDRSLVTYGDQQIIPNNLDDALGMVGTGLQRVGEVSAAFPGVGTLIDDAGSALGAGLGALRAKPKPPVEIIPGASKEGDAILAAERAKRDAARAVKVQAAEDAAKAARGAAYQAEAAKKGSTGTVPALSPRKDREAILRGLPEGTAPMPIKGRQGMPTRDEQISLVDKYLSRGGRAKDLPPGDGPWGPSPQGQADRAREAIQRAWDKESGRRSTKNDSVMKLPADQPTIGMLSKAYKSAKDEAALLREQIARLTGKSEKMVPREELDRLRALLKETQMDLISLQKAKTASPRRPYQPKWPDPDDVTDIPGRAPPRVFRRDQ